MILLSTISVIRLLICGNSSSWLLNLNLTTEFLGNGLGNGSIWGRFISILANVCWETQLNSLDHSNNSGVIAVKWMY